MDKTTILRVALGVTVSACACGSSQEKHQALHLQLKITGNGLAEIETQVYSRGKQKFLMFGNPAQEMRFRNTDAINYSFPLGKTNAAYQFDSTSIKRGEVLSFDFKIRRHKLARVTRSAAKPLLHITLLADGKEVGRVELPAVNASPSKSVAGDSTASLIIHTDSL